MGFLVLIFVLILCMDLPFLFQKKNKRELIVYGVLFVIVLTVCALYTMDVPLPSAMLFLGELMKKIGFSY